MSANVRNDESRRHRRVKLEGSPLIVAVMFYCAGAGNRSNGCESGFHRTRHLLKLVKSIKQYYITTPARQRSLRSQHMKARGCWRVLRGSDDNDDAKLIVKQYGTI